MPKTKIQVNMFEIQLGAGLLLQFMTADDQTIRVLADAGVKANKYKKDHVQKKDCLRRYAKRRLLSFCNFSESNLHLTGGQ